MRYVLVLALLFCVAAATTQPATTQATSVLLTEPSASHAVVGKVFTLRGLDTIRSLKNVVITNSPNARSAADNGLRIDDSNLETVLRGSTPVAPDDKLFALWHYAPWCTAKFEIGDQSWSAKFYLGGLGFLSDAEGRQGTFTFTPPVDGK